MKKRRKRIGWRPLTQFFTSNPLRRTESGRLCYHSRSDLVFGDEDETDVEPRKNFKINFMVFDEEISEIKV